MNHTENQIKQEEIGLGNVSEILREESEKITAFAAKFVKNAISQLHYDVLTNLPTGILSLKEIKDHALKLGIVTAISALNHYDITETMLICGDILEDVNAHKEAAEIRKSAYEVA